MLDVLIAGAGTGGAALAAMLAAKGRGVLLVDARPESDLGHDWCDAVERRACQILGFADTGEWEAAVPARELVVNAPDEKTWKTVYDFPYVLLDRKPFLMRMIDEGRKAGAQFRDRTRVLYPLTDPRKVFGAAVETGGRIENVLARVTVDATGLDGALRRKLPKEWDVSTAPIEARDVARAVREVRRFRGAESTHPSPGVTVLHYGRRNGYSWITREAADRVDLGAGVMDVPGAADPRDLLRQTIDGLPGIEGRALRGGEGRLPLRRALANLVWNGFAILGDAASQAMPLTGANTGTILHAAQVAAEVIDEALGRPQAEIEHLWRYNVQYHRGRGAVLASLDVLRRFYQSLSEDDLNYLFRRDLITADHFSRFWHVKAATLSTTEAAMATVRGATRPRLVARMRDAYARAREVLRHYHAYPQTYQALEFRGWVQESRRLFTRPEADALS
jgi:flavin-dependent dehydrogenase